MLRNFRMIWLALPIAAGCAEDRPIEPGNVRPVEFVPNSVVSPEVSAVVREYDLSEIGGTVTGVTIAPESGRRLLVTQAGVIFEAGHSEPLYVLPSAGNDVGYTDIAALGGDLFALTTMSDGYLFNLATGELTQHFCYEPDWFEEENPPEPGNPRVQLSLALAHDDVASRIYAQPRTIDGGGAGLVLDSFVANYDTAGGEDLTWWSFGDPSYAAEGMAVIQTGESAQLLLGSNATLSRFDVSTGELRPVTDLALRSIEQISGLAIDREAQTILVLDGSDNRLTELRLSALGL